jgi:hypothetical protein
MIQKILIIIVSVSIFGLLLFVYVKNQIKKRIDFYLQEKTKDTKRHNNLSNFSYSFFDKSKIFFEVS